MEITDLVRNKRAFLTLFITLIGSVLIFSLFTLLASTMLNKVGAAIAFLGFVLAFTFFLVGVSGAGFHLTDLIYNREQRTISEAFMAGLVTLPRLLGVQIMIFILALLALLAMVILLFIAKIPGVGPFIYFFVYPVCIFISAATIFSLAYIAILSGPAIWTGQTAMRTISMLAAILKTKLFAVIMQQLLLGLIVFFTISILLGVISAATGFTSLLSVPILQIRGGGFEDSVGMMMSGAGLRYASGYMIAAGLDLALIGAAAFTLPMLMFMAGNCIIFKNAAEGLNTEEIEKSIQSRLSKIKEQTNAAKERLNEVKASLPTPAAVATAPAASNCSACGEAISPDDAFCGSCGNKIK